MSGTVRWTRASCWSEVERRIASWDSRVAIWNFSVGLSMDATLTGVPVGSVIVAFGLPPVAALAVSGLRECLPLVQFLPRWLPAPDRIQELVAAS